MTLLYGSSRTKSEGSTLMYSAHVSMASDMRLRHFEVSSSMKNLVLKIGKTHRKCIPLTVHRRVEPFVCFELFV